MFQNVIGSGVVQPGGLADPSSVLNLALWLDGDCGVTASAGRVSAWADQSGNSRDYTQATANKQPLLQLAVVNGHDVIRFDAGIAAAFTHLEASLLIASNIVELAAFFVIQTNIPLPAVEDGMIWTHRSAVTELVQTAYAGGANQTIFHQVRDSGSALASIFPGVTYTDLQFQLVESVTDRNTPFYSVLIDQGAALTDTTALPGTVTSVDETIGAQTTNAGGSYITALNDSSIASIVIYDRAISGAETTTVRNFLKTRYGI